MAAARVNRLFIACCDRTGTERGQQWTAGTAIIDEAGWVIATQTEEGPAGAEIDLALARDKRLTDLCDALGDRRPELYRPLTAPSPAEVDAEPIPRVASPHVIAADQTE